jgi:hypothetical protein
MTYSGALHILRSKGLTLQSLPNFSVIFAPYGPTRSGGAVPSVNFHAQEHLQDFLRSLRVGERGISDATRSLGKDGHASIDNVTLSEQELRTAALL